MTEPRRPKRKRERRTISVHAHLTAREYMLATGMAWLARKSVPRMMSDVLTVALYEFQRENPGVLEAAAREALARSENEE